jgi:hypothetical protein
VHVTHKLDDQTFPESGILSPEEPIAVFNSGTPGYTARGMQELVDDMNIPGLVEAYLNCTGESDKNRGNYQKSFGICCGMNVGDPTPEEAIRYGGVCLPQMVKKSDDDLVKKARKAAWKLGRLAGIPYCQEGYFEQNEGLKKYMDFIEGRLGESETYACFTVFCLPLNGLHKVLPHKDVHNCPWLPCSLVIGMTCGELEKGTAVRMGVVCSMEAMLVKILLRKEAMFVKIPLPRWPMWQLLAAGEKPALFLTGY